MDLSKAFDSLPFDLLVVYDTPSQALLLLITNNIRNKELMLGVTVDHDERYTTGFHYWFHIIYFLWVILCMSLAKENRELWRHYNTL